MKKKSSEESTSSKKTEKKTKATMQHSDMENHSIEKNDLSHKTMESKDLFIMLEDSLAANFITVPSGKLVYCNKAFLDLFGFKTKEEAFNYPVEKLYPSAAARINFIKELKANKKLDGFEAVHVAIDGRIIHTLENMVGVFDDSGELIKIMGNLVDISERKQAEKSLRESENKYRDLIELAADGILLGSKEGIIIGANSQMQKLSGRTLDQLLGKHISELFSAGELNKIPLRFDLLMKGETVFSERSLVKIDGSLVNIEMNTKMMPDGTYQSIYRDISARRISEKALVRSEEKYRKTFFISPDSVNINRLEDGKYVSVNAGFTKIMGFSESEVIGKTSVELNIWVNSEDRKKLVDGLKKEGIVQNLEAQFRKKNGEIRFGLMSASVLDLDGVPHIVSITRDITERIKAEEALQKSESKLQAIFSAMTDVILVLDSEGRYLEIPPSNPSLLYRPPQELLGRTMHEVLPKEQADFFLSHVTKCLSSRQTVRMEYYLEIENKKIWFSALLSPLTSDSILLVARDVTEQKKAEEKLKESDQTYRGIINCIDEAIYVQDKDGTFLDVNEGAVKMYGYTREELIGQNPLFVSAEGKNDIQKVAEKVKLAFEGIPQEFEFWGKRKNGQIFPKIVSVYKGLYFGKDVCLAVAQDVTEKKQVVQTLKDSEERYKSLFSMFRLVADNSEDLLWAKDLGNKYIFANKMMCEKLLCAKDTDEPVGKDDLFFAARQREAHPENPEWHTFGEICANSDEIILKEKTAKQFDEYGNVKGKFIFFDVHKAPIWDFSGKMIGVVGTARDVTKEKSLEKETAIASEKLKESEERFRNLIENITDVFYIADARGKMKYCSPNFFTFTGYAPEEILGFIYIRVVHPSDRKKVIEHYTKAANSGVLDTNMALRVQRKDGTVFWAGQNTRIVRDEKGNVLEYRTVARDINQQKQAEEELRQSEERFRLISNLTSDYVFSTKINEDGTIELDWVMGAFEKITGYSVQEYKAIGGWQAMVHPDDREKDLIDFHKLQNNEKVIGEVRSYHKNGNIVWTRSYAHPIWDENENKLIGIYGAVQDITHQKTAEEKIRKSELHFRSIWENSLDGMRLTDENGIIVSVNDSFAGLFEKDKNEIIGKNIAVVYGEDSGFNDVATFIERFKKRTIDPFMERDITLWNGKPMSVELTNSFIEIEGQPPLLLSIFNNVTERVQNERLLKESNEFNASLLKNAPFGMDIVNEEGIILFQSDNLKSLFGGDSIRKKCWESYSKDKVQCNDCPLKSEIIIGKTSRTQKGNLIAGRTFEIFHTGINFQGKKALLETFMDITSQKEAELEITAAKEKAEEANKVKTNFLENMSHELRTPMIPILGFTELMEAMELPDEVKSMAAMMNKSANRLMDTLNIILDLAQIEKERVLLKPALTNLNKTVEEVCGLFQTIAKERNLYLRSEYTSNAITITTDERILRHAINNLINNGLKFTQKGGVTIKLSTQKSGDNNFALIQVCDTGIGIPKDKQNIIWEEFRQASEGIGRSFEGNGLGLTITKNFIEQLKGEVWVESEIGKGSIFNIKLPNVENVGEKKVVPFQPEIPVVPVMKQEPPVEMSSLKKVLYVEDEEISFSVVKHFLKNKIALDWARSGQDGVVMAKGNNYEAILMDINLARGIDGMQTTKLIRELPQYEKTPIIAITAFAMRGDKEEFLGAGCSHYISKPFSKAALLTLMGDALGEKVE